MANFTLHENINVRIGNGLLGPTDNYKVQYVGYFPNVGSPRIATKIRSYHFLLNPALRFHINGLNRDVRPPSRAPTPVHPEASPASGSLLLTSCPTSDLTHPLRSAQAAPF